MSVHPPPDYDAIAERYHAERSAYYARHPNPSSEMLRAPLRGTIRGKRVLDMGCGTGGDMGFLVEEGAKAYGIDPSDGMLDIARREHPAACLSRQSCEWTDFPDAFFDVVISKYALNHVLVPDLAFAEMHRVSKPGALLSLVIAHPIAEMLSKDGGAYDDASHVLAPLWEGRISVSTPAHTLEAYLGSPWFRRFSLLEFREGPSAPVRDGVPWRVPFFFYLLLRKPRIDWPRLLRRRADPS
jgi:ubiquinone/menaquinone biosynthesis C-methylase UbiE